MLVPIPSEYRERKEKYRAPWGGKGGKASCVQGSSLGIGNFYFQHVSISWSQPLSYIFVMGEP